MGASSSLDFLPSWPEAFFDKVGRKLLFSEPELPLELPVFDVFSRTFTVSGAILTVAVVSESLPLSTSQELQVDLFLLNPNPVLTCESVLANGAEALHAINHRDIDGP